MKRKSTLLQFLYFETTIAGRFLQNCRTLADGGLVKL